MSALGGAIDACLDHRPPACPQNFVGKQAVAGKRGYASFCFDSNI